MAHHGVFITSPEYRASVTPLLKNAIDWVSRVRERGIRRSRFQGPRICDRFGIARVPRGIAFTDGAAANSGARLRRACDPRAGRDPACGTAFDDMDNIVECGSANLFRAELAAPGRDGAADGARRAMRAGCPRED